LSKDSELKLLN